MSHMNDLNGPLHIFTMNSDGTNIRQLTQEGNAGDPVWSPDGKQISFGSDREGNNKLNIFVMNADGSNVRQLTHFNTPYESGDTNWSGDGTKIIFEWDVNGQKQSNPGAYAEVWTMNADGTQQTSTHQACSCVGAAPRWKPD
jgi:TolB protein